MASVVPRIGSRAALGSRPMSGFRVLICGGGIAGIEGLLRLRRLVGDDLAVTVLAPNERASVQAARRPGAVRPPRSPPLPAPADRQPHRGRVRAGHARVGGRRPAGGSHRRGQALGTTRCCSRRRPRGFPFEHAHDLRRRSRRRDLPGHRPGHRGGLRQARHADRSRGAGVVRCPSTSWPCRPPSAPAASGFDDVHVTVITPEEAPLAGFGPRGERRGRRSRKAGVRIVAGSRAEVPREPPGVHPPEGRAARLREDRGAPPHRGPRDPGRAGGAGRLHPHRRSAAGWWAWGSMSSPPVTPPTSR